jgi:hypothetical protein
MQTTNDNVDNNATTQTMGGDADNNNAPRRRQQGDMTTIQKRVVVALVRARAVEVALATMVAVAAVR